MEIYGIIISLIAGLSTVIGSLFIFFRIKQENIDKFITFSLSLSLSIMILLSVVELFPESFFNLINTYHINGIYISLVCLLIGFLLINSISKKISKYTTSNNLYRVGILSAIALMLHNIPEGIATYLSTYTDLSLGIKLGISIMLHNIPEGIAIAVPIYYSTGNKIKAIKHTFISGLSEPLGALLAYLFLTRFVSQNLISIVLIVVSSIMITLSIEDILPQAKKYKNDKFIIYGFIIGIILFFINYLIF